MPEAPTIRIPRPRAERQPSGLYRVAAELEGTEVFYESSLPLVARRESLVSAFLLPAMARGANLEVDGALDARFLENLELVRTRAREWWPHLSAGEVRADSRPEAAASPDAGLFYTGGADSSYALQQLHGSVRYAVFTEGFDIRLDDAARLAAARRWLSETARACGVAFVVVRTNLRAHPLFRSLSWEITHGAALASVAHALSGVVSTMYMAASDVEPPWGSSPELDAAWSSGAMRIENFSHELSRLQRVASIARWEPLRGRLRVCWENKSSDLNCGFCEKCVRTRLQLHASGAPDGLDSFPDARPLRSAIRFLEPVQHELHGQWREIGARLEDPRLRRQVERVLSGRYPPAWLRAARGTRRYARRASRWAARRAASILF
jgi:hypothetical protein